MKYKIVVCGGTFDLLHSGHKSFINQIFDQSDEAIIGLTSDSYASKYKEEISENFKARRKNLLEFLSSENYQNRAEIVSLDDIYGPLLDKNLIADALAVTPQTNRTAIGINKERVELGLSSMEILVLKMDSAEDGGLISSTRIRNGEIDRNGKLFINPKWKGKSFVLPQNLRSKLHEPFGEIINSIPKNLNPDNVVTIGDITTKKFNNVKAGQLLSIVDFTVERRKKFNQISELGFREDLEVIKVNNPPGQISWDLFLAIINAFKDKKRKIVLVNGEEDLAVLPVLLAAPLSFSIYYGQPDEGLVEIEVNEKSKEEAFNLVNKFNLS